MSYHHHFNHLGQRAPRRHRGLPAWAHRFIQRLGGIAIVLCLGILVWGR